MNRTRLVSLTLVFLLVGVTVTAAAVPADRALVVRDASSGDVLVSQPVSDGTVVSLNYTHSVVKTPIVDQYTVRGDTLIMTEMRFMDYGWGLPAREEVRIEDGWFVFDPPGEYTEIVVQPGRVAGHTLRVGDRTYDLVERSNAEAVTITVERRSVLTAALGRLA